MAVDEPYQSENGLKEKLGRALRHAIEEGDLRYRVLRHLTMDLNACMPALFGRQSTCQWERCGDHTTNKGYGAGVQ